MEIEAHCGSRVINPVPGLTIVRFVDDETEYEGTRRLSVGWPKDVGSHQEYKNRRDCVLKALTIVGIQFFTETGGAIDRNFDEVNLRRDLAPWLCF